MVLLYSTTISSAIAVVITSSLLMILPHNAVQAVDEYFEFNCPDSQTSTACCAVIFRNNVPSDILYNPINKTCKIAKTSAGLTPINEQFQACCKNGGKAPEKTPANTPEEISAGKIPGKVSAETSAEIPSSVKGQGEDTSLAKPIADVLPQDSAKDQEQTTGQNNLFPKVN